MSKESNAAGGIGFTGMLTILFIALKLTHQIAWTWFWVLSPIWITMVLVFGIFFIFLLCVTIPMGIQKLRRR